MPLTEGRAVVFSFLVSHVPISASQPVAPTTLTPHHRLYLSKTHSTQHASTTLRENHTYATLTRRHATPHHTAPHHSKTTKSKAQHSAARHGAARRGTEQRSTGQHSMPHHTLHTTYRTTLAVALVTHRLAPTRTCWRWAIV